MSSPDSKFGHPLHTVESRAEVVEAFQRFSWLTALHAHVGSAGTSLPMLAQGSATLISLADEIDSATGSAVRVTSLDIGGGLACSSASDGVAPTFMEYADVLREAAPGLFSCTNRRVFTEFGQN